MPLNHSSWARFLARVKRLLRKSEGAAYPFGMASPRELPSVTPEAFPAELEDPELAGKWAALEVASGRLLAANTSSSDLVDELRTRGLLGKVVVRFVAPVSRGVKVGLG